MSPRWARQTSSVFMREMREFGNRACGKFVGVVRAFRGVGGHFLLFYVTAGRVHSTCNRRAGVLVFTRRLQGEAVQNISPTEKAYWNSELHGNACHVAPSWGCRQNLMTTTERLVLFYLTQTKATRHPYLFSSPIDKKKLMKSRYSTTMVVYGIRLN